MNIFRDGADFKNVNFRFNIEEFKRIKNYIWVIIALVGFSIFWGIMFYIDKKHRTEIFNSEFNGVIKSVHFDDKHFPEIEVSDKKYFVGQYWSELDKIPSVLFVGDSIYKKAKSNSIRIYDMRKHQYFTYY